MRSVFGDVTENSLQTRGPACFPGAATILLDSGVAVPMADVRIGDRVQVGVSARGEPVFSAVYMFSHRDASALSTFCPGYPFRRPNAPAFTRALHASRQ